jgi:glycosyltransferase involved in cell wall biosynthesis
MDKLAHHLLAELVAAGANIQLLDQGMVETGQQLLRKTPIFYGRLRHLQANVYHALSEYSAALAILGKKHPLVTTIHDVVPFHYMLQRPLVFSYQATCAKLAARSDRFIATSFTTRKAISRVLNIPLNKISVIYYGVDHTTYRPRTVSKQKCEKTILYVGEISRSKGVFDLLTAFTIMSRKLSPAKPRLILVGKGRDLPRVRRMIDGGGMNVELKGYVEEAQLPYYYNRSDAFVWPSYFGFGLSVLEAMASGLPVIASDTFDTAEYVSDAGFLYQKGDVTALADTMFDLLLHDDLHKKMSEKGLARVKEFDWKNSALKMIDIYRELSGDV